MPIKMKERALFSPGNLVKTRTAIYSTDPSMRLPEGTVGTILQQGGKGGKGGWSKEHCQVQFVAVASPWWVNFSEIEPWLENK